MNDMSARIIRWAAHRTPLAERLEEEWLADMSERQGWIARLRFALGCCWAGAVISADDGIATAAALRTCSSTVAQVMTTRAQRPGLRKSIAAASLHGSVCEINTTPLIDVMLVLLVTLIVSLPIMTHAIKMDLPHPPPSAQPAPPEVIELDIEFDGTLVWNGTAVAGFDQLERYLHAAARQDPQPEIHLRPDRRVSYDVVARVLATTQHNRMQKLGFVNTAEFKD